MTACVFTIAIGVFAYILVVLHEGDLWMAYTAGMVAGIGLRGVTERVLCNNRRKT